MPRKHKERKDSEMELRTDGEEFYWYLVLDHHKDDLLVIMKSRTSVYVPSEDAAIDAELGDVSWYLVQTTKTEYETYQAFGITEIKL